MFAHGAIKLNWQICVRYVFGSVRNRLYCMDFLCGLVHTSECLGKFKEQATSNSAWLPVLKSKVPEPRPGTCVEDTASLPDSVLNFIRSHPLMDRAVNHMNNNPVFFKRDLVFTKIVVDK